MTKSVMFAIFLLGILIAQVACARSTRSKSRSKSPNARKKVDATPNQSDPTADNDAPWILPGFDKNQTLKLNRNNKKCWTGDGNTYHVCLIRNEDGTKLIWQKEKFKVDIFMEVSSNGEEITQTWKYKDMDVQLDIKEDGSANQHWKFGSDGLEVNRYDGKSETQWYGTQRPKKVEEFKKFIDSWCKYNDFFVGGKDNCVIYDKIKVNNDPAWSLPGLDKTQVYQPKKNGRKCWTGTKCHSCLIKKPFETELDWGNKKSNTQVNMTISEDGSIYQGWTYQGKSLEINKQKDGSMSQEWKFGPTTFIVYKDSEGKTEKNWTGVIQNEGLKQFRDFIDSWCEYNEVFVEKANCMIYKD